jgi:DNA-binding MarR family transcriptional regulator
VVDNYLSETLGGSSPHWRRQLPELFFGVVRRLRHHAAEAAAEFDLSFLQARALFRLEQPTATGTLAEQLGLDRSNVTSVVDRLEDRGLVTRQTHPGDRRVKLLVLTDAGRATRAAIDERIFETVTLFEALSEEDQRALAGLLSKLLERADPAASAPVVP